MDFRLYPQPTPSLCTPFSKTSGAALYSRYLFDGGRTTTVNIGFRMAGGSPRPDVDGVPLHQALGHRLPDRHRVAEFLARRRSACWKLADYVSETYVVPTFPLTVEETLIKTMIRQVISANQARAQFSAVIRAFGYESGGLFGFPSLEQLGMLKASDLRRLGLGFKAERICEAIQVLTKCPLRDLRTLAGIGSWSAAVIEAEMHKDLASYPFWDKSGQKVNETFGVDLNKIALRDRALAGDIYLYAVSYFEAHR